jgi:hypothetical protein
MKKSPVPSPDGVPPCFGVQHDERDPGCKRCPVVAHCAPIAAGWGRSLSEALAEVEARLFSTPTNELIEETYDRLYRDIFGRRSRRNGDRYHDLFGRVVALCGREEIDVATYIAGNMWAMKPWVDKNPVGFQPSHLSGERALKRYYAYFGRQKRRFRQQHHTGRTSGTLAADIRQNFAIGEYAVGLEYARAFIADGVDDWMAAVNEARPNADWLAIDVGCSGRRNHELRVVFGHRRLQEEKIRAELYAACAIAELYEHGLQHRIGLGTAFDWPSFAALLARLFPLPGDIVSPVVGMTGVEWHG